MKQTKYWNVYLRETLLKHELIENLFYLRRKQIFILYIIHIDNMFMILSNDELWKKILKK